MIRGRSNLQRHDPVHKITDGGAGCKEPQGHDPVHKVTNRGGEHKEPWGLKTREPSSQALVRAARPPQPPQGLAAHPPALTHSTFSVMFRMT